MTAVFYVSGHGFGHASRDVEVINVLGAASSGRRVVIRSAASPELFARTLRVPYELLPGECDTGLVQTSSVENDDQATVDVAERFYRTFHDRAAAECDRLAAVRPDVIVGDIAPLAFEVAARMGRPSAALANFTWDWIYETHPGFLPRAATTLATIRSAYGKATCALQLPFSGGFEVFPRVRPVPLIARRPTESRASARTRFGLPTGGKVALLSFGGYGLPTLELSTVDCREDWTIVTTDHTSPTLGPPPPHVRFISSEKLLEPGARYENLVAAVDAVITKPGYGIMAECISTSTPMLYTSRGRFREYDLLVSQLPRFVRSRFISQADLFAGRWREALERLLAEPDAPERMPLDGAEVVAGLVAEVSRGGG